jgi:hypothetical protein
MNVLLVLSTNIILFAILWKLHEIHKFLSSNERTEKYGKEI